MPHHTIASGFEFAPLPDGTVRIEFCDDNGSICNSQVVTADAFQKIPLAAFVTTTAMGVAPEVARRLLRAMLAVEDIEDERDEEPPSRPS